MQEVIDTIQSGKDEHIEKLKDWLRIPSVSTDSKHKDDVRRAGEFVMEELREGGFDVEMHDTPGHPVVTGSWLGAPGEKTLLVYGHYDVQPPDPVDLWRHGPFEPTIEGENIVARGATDDKGQALALVRGISAYLKVAGKLPINVKFLIEGEEEIGSPNLSPFIEANKDMLAADVVLVSDCSQFGPGRPAITVALKGLMYFDIEVVGPNRDLHSGSFGGGVENPGHALCKILSSLKDDNGRITIPGFYDDVVDLTTDERAAFAELPFDEDGYRDDLGVKQLHGEEGYTTVERTWARPTLDVNGLLCGWTGEGAKTVLPSKASGKFSMRLVANQDPDKIKQITADHIQSICPETVRVTVTPLHGAVPVLVPSDSPYLAAAKRAMAQGFGTEPVFIREGGSIPVVATFKQLLGIDTILMGLGLHDDNAHSPNEKFNLGDYQRGIETVAYLLDEIAQV